MTIFLWVTAVEPVGGLRHAVIDDAQGGVGGVFQGHGQRFFLTCREGGQHPCGKVVFRVRLGTYPDLDPGKILTAQLLNDGLDAVVPAGGTLGANRSRPGSREMSSNITMIRWGGMPK